MSSNPNPDEEIICQCFQVADTTIKGCIKDGNLETIEDVTEACGAGGGCQSCHMLIQLFLDQHHKINRSPSKDESGKEGGVKKRGIFSKLFARF